MSRYSLDLFPDHEVKCKCCGLIILDPEFDRQLTKLRLKFGQPMIPTSCCRCQKHNAEVGGKLRSFHICDKPAWKKLKGTAAIDVKYTKLFYRNRLARIAWELGWRIGYHHDFLHLDVASILGIMKQNIFKYDVVSDAELEKFKNIIINKGE